MSSRTATGSSRGSARCSKGEDPRRRENGDHGPLVRHGDTPSQQPTAAFCGFEHGEPHPNPPPLAGEGWGGGFGAMNLQKPAFRGTATMTRWRNLASAALLA